MIWTEKCQKRCRKLGAAVTETEEKETNGKRKKNEKTRKQTERKKGESQDNVVKKVGPLETFINFFFRRS